ncbi:MAG: response regulator transcription factor [Acidobacteriota bacterium]|nr:MAG: response regulator transcription factor [Acidobacteriota bacterium]
MAIRIIIADDHSIFRSGLRALLEKEGDIEIVAETGNGFDAIRLVGENKIDVLLLDLTMPGLPGSKVAETVLEANPRLAIVVLTMHDDEYYLKELFKMGIRAFVLKKSTGSDLVQAIRKAHRGETYVDPSLAGKVLSSFYNPSGQSKARLDLLTPREQEVCTLLAYGHTNVEIAEKLCISERTVESHRTNITGKLDLKSRAELVRFAIENGLLKMES